MHIYFHDGSKMGETCNYSRQCSEKVQEVAVLKTFHYYIQLFLHFVISNSCLACGKENSAFVEITTLDIQQVRLRLGEC